MPEFRGLSLGVSVKIRFRFAQLQHWSQARRNLDVLYVTALVWKKTPWFPTPTLSPIPLGARVASEWISRPLMCVSLLPTDLISCLWSSTPFGSSHTGQTHRPQPLLQLSLAWSPSLSKTRRTHCCTSFMALLRCPLSGLALTAHSKLHPALLRPSPFFV